MLGEYTLTFYFSGSPIGLCALDELIAWLSSTVLWVHESCHYLFGFSSMTEAPSHIQMRVPFHGFVVLFVSWNNCPVYSSSNNPKNTGINGFSE